MPLEREDEEFGFGFVPSPRGEVTILWSSGHEMQWYYGDSFTALQEYQRALTLPRMQIDQLPKRPSTRRVREHHVVELVLNGHWRIDPIRCDEALNGKRAWKNLDEQKAAFDGRLTSITMPPFFQRTAHLVEVERFEQLLPAVANLPFSSYHKTIVVIGDDPTDLAEQDRLHLKSVCAALIEAAAGHYDVAVVDRGRRSMISQLLGDRVSWRSVLLVGVACAATVVLPDARRRETPVGKSELEPSHAAFFLVPGTQPTDEAAWLAKVASAFAGIDPSIALLIHGGEEAWQDVFAQLDEHRRVVALEGTGGIADLLAAAVRGEHVDDWRAIKGVASGLIRTIPLDGLDEIRHLLGVIVSPFPVDLDGKRVDLVPRLPRGPFAMEPVRAAGFGAPEGKFYYSDDEADEQLANDLCQKYYGTAGDASRLLEEGWLIINADGEVRHSLSPTPEQVTLLQRIAFVVGQERPKSGKQEAVHFYLRNIQDALARFEREQ